MKNTKHRARDILSAFQVVDVRRVACHISSVTKLK